MLILVLDQKMTPINSFTDQTQIVMIKYRLWLKVITTIKSDNSVLFVGEVQQYDRHNAPPISIIE